MGHVFQERDLVFHGAGSLFKAWPLRADDTFTQKRQGFQIGGWGGEVMQIYVPKSEQTEDSR